MYVLKFFPNIGTQLGSAALISAVTVNARLSKLQSIHKMEYYATVIKSDAELYILMWENPQHIGS